LFKHVIQKLVQQILPQIVKIGQDSNDSWASGTIQLTRSTSELIKDDFICGVKGKVEMELWPVLAPK
jgi:hypothetical protein